jgi:alginate O-acetyltransferase complex protein AlgI
MKLLFNSFQFALFFIVFWLAFLALRGTPRKVLLLIASYYFYMCWSTKYIWVIVGITLIDYIAGIKIENSKLQNLRSLYLGISLACNIGLLIVFKYANLFSRSLTSGMHFAGLAYNVPLMHIILPVGLSFHTFQAMSYTIDVYKRKAPAERSLLNYALYVAFFPQMVAGPIERPNELLPQFHREPGFSVERIRSGFAQALWGLFKKMVLADSVSGFVNLVYQSPQGYSGASLLLATCFFALQIYCDFSGYSDIAVGLARVMGYDLRINFRQPYFSQSITEFWRRWHITLSSWFRDYFYIPIGGSRVRPARHYLNLMLTFALSGLWHGANWTFVIWGALHGLYMVVGHLTESFRARMRYFLGLQEFPRMLAAWQMVVTASLVTVAWIFFRADSLASGWYVLSHLLPLGHFDSQIFLRARLSRVNAFFVACFTLIMFSVEWWAAHPSRIPRIWSFAPFRQVCYYACIYAVICFGVFGRIDFIYFQF